MPNNDSKKIVEFFNFDEEGKLIDKSDSFSTKIEEIDHNEKISKNVIFR